jgi:GT2 family glycosyltransferase
MRVLAHIHTFNDSDVIDQTIEALLKQSRPIDGILVVDNGSTDGTLDRPSLKSATVVRHRENLGTSGTVATGMRFALQHNYDWIWVFDADSIPDTHALEKLLDLYASWPSNAQETIAFLACLACDTRNGEPTHGHVFTRRGFDVVTPPPVARAYRCHSTIWSGCLYRLAAVRRIGLPNPDYMFDCGEGEYGYRLMKAGYNGFIQQDAVLHHNIRGHTSLRRVEVKWGPITFALFEFSPLRCYYVCRNVVYFALYDFAEERLGYLRSISWWVYGFTPRFFLKPWSHRKHIVACLRGLWHGFTGNIAARY